LPKGYALSFPIHNFRLYLFINKNEAEARARGHLADLLELRAVQAPFSISLHNKALAEESYWFTFRFPGECWIGAGWVIAIRKTDGSLAYFGTDGGE